MSNISFIYPTSGTESHLNNTFIVKDNKCKNAIIKIGEEEFVFPLVEVEELIPYVEYYKIGSIRTKVDTFISCKDGINLIKEINEYEILKQPNIREMKFNGRINDYWNLECLLYSNEEISVDIKLDGYGVCVINNVFLWESSKIVLPANIVYPMRLITGRNGYFTINASKNIFFIPKETNE